MRGVWLYTPNSEVGAAIRITKGGDPKRLDPMAAQLAEWVAERWPDVWPADAILPVPLHSTKTKNRGFDQAAELAQRVAPLVGLPYRPDLLERTRATMPQREQRSAEARVANTRDAFGVAAHRRPQVKGRSFLLVDDVATTGQTAWMAARALRLAGAARVDVAVYARTPATTG